MPIVLGKSSYYTLPELSDIMEVSTVTLRKYLTSGELQGRKFAGKWLVPEESLRDFLTTPAGWSAHETKQSGEEPGE